jgi:hypothetical protein
LPAAVTGGVPPVAPVAAPKTDAPATPDQPAPSLPAAITKPPAIVSQPRAASPDLALVDQKQAEEAKKAAEAEARIRSNMDKQKEIAAEIQTIPVPEAPKPAPLPRAPGVYKMESPFEALGGLVPSMLAVFSLKSRAPLAASLGAMAGVMDGFTQGRIEGYKENMTKWKADFDNAIQTNNEEVRAYEQVLQQKRMSVEQKTAALSALAAQNKDEVGLVHLNNGQFDEFMKTVNLRREFANDAERHFVDAQRLLLENKRMTLEEERNTIAMERQAKLDDLKAQETQGKIDKLRMEVERGKQNLSGDTAVVEAVANYEIPPPSLRDKDYSSKMVAIKKANPDYDATLYNSKNKVQSDPKLRGQVQSFNTAINHLNTLHDLAESLNNNDVTMFNKIANGWGSAFGKPEPKSFDAAKKIVGDEIVKSIIGTGGGVADREKAEEILGRDIGPEQIDSVIATLKELMGGQLFSIAKTYENAGIKNFEKKLTPEAAEVFDELKGKKGSKGFSVPEGAPSAEGVADGQTLKMDGKVIARAKDGKWVTP